MFAYVVKRLLSGVVVVALVSLSVFLLFFKGPSSPAQPICDRDTGNRCTPARLAIFEQQPRLRQPLVHRVRHVREGHLRRPGDPVRQRHHLRVPRAVPRLLLPHQGAGLRGAEGADPGDLLGRDRRRRPLPAPRHPHRGGRRAKTRHRHRQGPGLQLPGDQLGALLPVRPADVAVPHRPVGDTADLRHRLLPVHRESSEVVLRDGPGLDRAGHLRLHDLHQVLPRLDGGDPQRGLHPHREGQGPAAAHRRLQARAALRTGAGDHHLRHRVRHPAGRHDLHRADLQHRRDRLLEPAGRVPPRTCRSWPRRPSSARSC